MTDESLPQTEAEWKERLTPEEYYVCREKGTEPAFSGEYNDCKKEGIYNCRACGEPLFLSDHKFNSGCGWPSFYATQDGDPVAETPDHSHGMIRVEITCRKCGSHLGHVFEDGPQPTGRRYCVNSLSVRLEEKDQ